MPPVTLSIAFFLADFRHPDFVESDLSSLTVTRVKHQAAAFPDQGHLLVAELTTAVEDSIRHALKRGWIS
jgi:hypothetical protein